MKTKELRDGRWHDIVGVDFNQARSVCYPLPHSESGEDHLLVSLETRTKDTWIAQVEVLNDGERQVYIRQMEMEVAQTREALQQTVEELQTANEELITVNEVLQVNSTELQSVSTELAATLEVVPFPVLVIDQALIVRRASQAAMAQLNIGDLPATGFHLSPCKLPSQMSSMASICNDVYKLRA